MSDARWFEIDNAIASAVKHFSFAVSIYPRIPGAEAPEDRQLVEMAFMHAMQSGHSSLENGLLKILELFGEAAPTGATRQAALIRRVASAIGPRPAILEQQTARAADTTRRFRNIAAHAYDSFDYTAASDAVASAAFLTGHLTAGIARFRSLIDP
jgi:hypothetical protein